MGMIVVAWLGVLLLLAICGASLYKFQTSPRMDGRIYVGIAAMLTGVFGLVLLAGLVFG